MAMPLRPHEIAYAGVVHDKGMHFPRTLWDESDEFMEVLRANEERLRSRPRSRPVAHEPRIDQPQEKMNLAERGPHHILLLALGSLAICLLGLLMLVEGVAYANGYPLSYAALALVAFGLFVGALAEWRARTFRR